MNDLEVREKAVHYTIVEKDSADLPFEERCLLGLLRDKPWQGTRSLARYCRWSRNRLRQHLRHLASEGFLTWVKRPGKYSKMLVSGSETDPQWVRNGPTTSSIQDQSLINIAATPRSLEVDMREAQSEHMDGVDPVRRAPSSEAFNAWKRRFEKSSGKPWRGTVSESIRIRKGLKDLEKIYGEADLNSAMKRFFILDTYAAGIGYPFNLFYSKVSQLLAARAT